MDWDRLRVFYYVAQSGSFTAASQILHISQPAVSRCIIILEERMGVTLFHRGARGLELTKEGAILYKHVLRMFAEANEALNEIKGKEVEAEGSLRILTTHALASTWLVYQLKDFCEAHPRIKVTVIGEDTVTNFDETDVAIRPYIPHQPELVQQYLTTLVMGLYASKDYLKEFGVPKTAEDLDHHRLITYGSNAIHPYLNTNWILQVGRRPEHAREPYLTLNPILARLNAAKLGLGIVALGKDDPTTKDAGLVEILPGLDGPKVEIYYTYPLHLKNSRRITALAEYFESKFTKEKQTTVNQNFIHSTNDLTKVLA